MKTISSRIGACIIATFGLGVVGASALQPSVKVPLGGEEFGKNLEIHVSSGDRLIAASESYTYQMVGSCAGTDDLAKLIPAGTPISTFLNKLSAGNSKYISGIYANPGGALPITVIDRKFSGKLTYPSVGLVTLSATIKAGITNTGEAYLDVVDVVVNSPGTTLKGTIKFQSGSKFVITTAPLIQFKTPTRSTLENSGTVDIYVTRFGNLKGTASADYTTVPGTADSSDYTPVSGTVVFANGETQQTITVPITDNADKDGTRVFALTLSSPNKGSVIGPKNIINVTIRDDD